MCVPSSPRTGSIRRPKLPPVDRLFATTSTEASSDICSRDFTSQIRARSIATPVIAISGMASNPAMMVTEPRLQQAMRRHGRVPAVIVDSEPRRGWYRAYDRSDVVPAPPIRLALRTQGEAEVNTSTAISVPLFGMR